MAFDKMLEKLRRKNGLQVAVLARQTGISKAKLQMYERGTEKPTLTEVLALSYVLKTSPEELEYWENGVTPKTNTTADATETSEDWDSAVQWDQAPKTDEKTKKKPSGAKPQGEESKKSDTTKGKQAAATTTETSNSQLAKKLLQEAEQATPKAHTDTAKKEPEQSQAGTAHKEDTSSQAATGKSKTHQEAHEQPAKKTPKAATTIKAKTEPYVSNVGHDISTIPDPDGTVAKKMKALGSYMQQYRKQKNIRYSVIQEQLGISMEDYVRIEHGRLIPTKELMSKIVKFFQIKT